MTTANELNGSQPKPDTRDKVDKFVDDLLDDAIEYRAMLRREGDDTGIKERITCLKYLEEIVKTHFILKKASTHDPDAAGSTVRKYATAFSKNATGGGKARGRGRKPATPDPAPALGFDIESDDVGDTA